MKMSCVWAARQGMFRRDLGIIQKYPVSPPTEGNRLIRVLALCSDCGCNLSHSCCSALLVHLTTPPFPRHCSCTSLLQISTLAPSIIKVSFLKHLELLNCLIADVYYWRKEYVMFRIYFRKNVCTILLLEFILRIMLLNWWNCMRFVHFLFVNYQTNYLPLTSEKRVFKFLRK